MQADTLIDSPAAAGTGTTLPALLIAGWLVTPFVSGALIAHSHRARDLVGTHHRISVTVGFTGIALLICGATALASPAGLLAFAVGGPLAGLSFWPYDGPDGRGDDGPGDDPPDHPLPPGPRWDWADFERDVNRYVESSRGEHSGVGMLSTIELTISAPISAAPARNARTG